MAFYPCQASGAPPRVWDWGNGGQQRCTHDFLGAGPRQGLRPTYPENFVSPRILSLVLEIILKNAKKIKTRKIIINWERGSGSTNPFPLTALMGDDIGSSLMVATNCFFLERKMY